MLAPVCLHTQTDTPTTSLPTRTCVCCDEQQHAVLAAPHAVHSEVHHHLLLVMDKKCQGERYTVSHKGGVATPDGWQSTATLSTQPPPLHNTHTHTYNQTPFTHLLQRVVRVVCLARPPWGVNHHEVEHAVAAELVEPLLANRLLGAVSEGAERASAAPGAWLFDKGVIHEPECSIGVEAWAEAGHERVSVWV